MAKNFESLFENFHKLSFAERQERLAKWSDLDPQELSILKGERALSIETAEHFIENVIGVFPLPLGVATNFNIDGNDVLIPMAVEETSIIAAISSTAKWVRKQGGTITTEIKGKLVIGQIQIPRLTDATATEEILKKNREHLIQLAKEFSPGLVARGGGVKDLQFRILNREDGAGKMLVIHVLLDPCDAMGANVLNQVCEGLKPAIERLTSEKIGLCILSNLVDTKLVKATVRIEGVDAEIAKGIEEATQFAKTDPYRAATHNKGVMNGIDPILIATGNDWRAVEAGIHAYVSQSGHYQPITRWWVEKKERPNHEIVTVLVGEFLAPLAVGTVGGVTQLHPSARLALKILNVKSAEDLARICAAAGLVQNLGALKALSTVGIVQGHMRLHTSNLAIAAGATDSEIPRLKEELAQALVREKKITLSRARELLDQIRQDEKY